MSEELGSNSVVELDVESEDVGASVVVTEGIVGCGIDDGASVEADVGAVADVSTAITPR